MRLKSSFVLYILSVIILMPISAFAITERVSMDDNGNQSNSDTYPVSITPNGKYVLFYSYADNLVVNDTNGSLDVFVRDTVNGTTIRANIDDSGVQANSDTYPISITPDGRYVLFHSYADNLVANDTNGQLDVFVRDTVNGTTIRANIDDSGTEGNNQSEAYAITPDGRYVLFMSYANNLVANDTNGASDVFVRDIINNTTTRVSVDSIGTESNGYSYGSSITPNGRYVLFHSDGNNLALNDTNGQQDIFVRDLTNNTTTLISADNSGNIGNSYSQAYSISSDGRYVLFDSYSDNLVANDTNFQQDSFVRDIVNNTTIRVSENDVGDGSNSYSQSTTMTPDGRYILFNSYADNLVVNDFNGQQDVFVKDIINNTIVRVSTDSSGNESNNYSNATAITSGGGYVLFYSDADNLIANDTNYQTDAFVKNMTNGEVKRVSVDNLGNGGNNYTYPTTITSDGRYVLFPSYADNLILNDTNGVQDIFINERQLLLGVAPNITSPADGSYRNQGGDIIVQGLGESGADIRVTFLGNQFTTVIDANNEWVLQLPSQLDATYTVYAQQKPYGAGVWSTTGTSTFTIDTSNPLEPTIITPTENQLVVGGNITIVGVGEIGGTVTVKVGSVTKVVGVDGMGNWSAGPFTIAPGYKYAIVAKQSDIAGNQSNWSDTRTIYGVVAGTVTVNDSDYVADLLLTKKGMSGTGSLTNTNPNENIRYTLDYLNVGNTYATGVIIHEEIPTNTCFTIGSISGLNSDYVVEYSNNKGLNYAYIPAGIVGLQDCTVTNFRVKYKIPYEAKMNVVSDDFLTSNSSHLIYEVRNVITSSMGVSVDTNLIRDEVLPGGVTSFHQGEGFISNTVIDFDNDGDQDIVGYGHLNQGSSKIYINDGNANFTEIILPGGYTNFIGGVVGDLNGDGLLDIVGFAYYNGGTTAYINNGSGSFSYSYLPGGHLWQHQGLLEDFDKDGDLDIVGFGFNGYQSIFYKNDGSGNFTDTVLPGGTTNFVGGIKGDVNSDGLIDIIGFGRSSSFSSRLYYNMGSGNFVITNITGGGTSYAGGKLIDIDGDSDLDLVGFGFQFPTKIYYNDGVGNFTPIVLPGGNTSFIGGSVIDINNDGYLDLVGYGGYSVSSETKSYINDGSGNFTVTTLPGGYTNFAGGFTFDIDKDNDIDVWGMGYNGNSDSPSKVYYNDGSGNFTDTIVPGGNTNFVGGGTGDFNNDGRIDIVGMGYGYHESKVFFTQLATSGSYTSILYSTGNNSGWNKLLVQDEIVSGENTVEYTLYGVIGGNICDTGNILIPKTSSYNGEVDISSVLGTNTGICVKVDLDILTGTTSPILRSLIATWNNEDVDSFTFDVKVNTGNFVGTTVTNTAYISSNVIELNTVNNSDSHILNGLPVVSNNGGGFGGGLGGNGGGTPPSNGGGSNGGQTVVIKGDLTPQEVAEIIKEIDTTKPDKPVVVIPPRNTPPTSPVTTVEVNPTTPNLAIKDAIVQTSYVSVGSTVEVKTVSNPALGSEKKCYTPKEVVDITLGKNTTNKDQLVYQALLKSYDLTMFSDTDTYMPENGLKRYEAAKMFTNFAKHVLCRESTSVYANSYTDIEGIDETLRPYIIQAYEYGILKGSKNEFRPLERISRKEFVAALMRMFTNENMDIQGKGNDWDTNYQAAFKSYGLESIVGVDEEINRYAMSKIMYKLYYNTTYEWTEKGYVLPYGRD